MNSHPVAAYLADCRARHKTGAVTPETSYYGPLETLLNAVGQKLKKPRVRCFMSLQNQSGNMPDGGLFTQDQISKGEHDPLPGQKPSRGVIEAKPFANDLAKLVAGTQVGRYWQQYHQVLVTNFREFSLIGRDHLGKPVRHEFYRLAASEKEFWQLASKPEQAEKEHGERLLEFLERCLRRPVPLTDPKDVAWFLASYARDARNRVEHSQAHRQVETVRKALEQSLGLKVEDEKGEHFFQSTLVQTLFYGLFSAWVLWHRSGPAASERFNWETASKYLHVPILRKLFRELTDPTNLDEWDNLTEVMGWAADTLNRVERGVQHGIVCYISNYSWLDGLSHTGLRERFLDEFDDIWIDSLNGDKYKTGKTTPDGKPDPSVFSTPHNREGIQVGTAVTLLARRPKHATPATIHFRDFWGDAKRDDLLKSLDKKPSGAIRVEPVNALGLPFRAMATEVNYTTWPLLEELFPRNFPGVQSKQDRLVVDIEHSELMARMSDYFSDNISDTEIAALHPGSMDGTHASEPVSTRAYLRKRGLLPQYVVKFLFRPFDVRWIYWEPKTKLLGRASPEYFPHVFAENIWLFSQKMPRRDWNPVQVGTVLGCIDTLDRSASCVPMLLRPVAAKGELFAERDTSRQIDGNLANISDAGLQYLQGMNGVTDHPHLFHHTIAILHAPSYATENAPALRQDWPRVPLPAERQRLLASAELGRQVAALLDPESKVEGVTSGKLSPALKLIGQPTKAGGGNFSDADGDYAVTARWGIVGKGGITMPAKGLVRSRPFDAAERTSLGDADLGGTPCQGRGKPRCQWPRPSMTQGRATQTDALSILGEETCDVFLNDKAHWKNVPRPVWEYTLGGYQVLKKWLSYRERSLLGRPLTIDEVTYFRDVIRRITALLLLGPKLDANYAATKANTYAFLPSEDVVS